MIAPFLRLLAVVACLVAAPALAADRYPGRVVGVTDGDTLDVLISADTAMALGMPRRKSPVVIVLRLGQVDTPEKGAPYGQKAKQGLSALVFDRDVEFTDDEVDGYERTVSTVYVGGLNVNAELVRRGFAWAYRRYQSDPALCVIEDEARRARRGLWGLQADQVVAPWEWRSRQRKRSEGPFTDYRASTAAQCIREMVASKRKR